MRRFQLRTSVCRKSLVCAISVVDAPNHDREKERRRKEGGKGREYAVARSRTVFSRAFPPSLPSVCPSSRQYNPLVRSHSSLRPLNLRSQSLRYLCTLRSRTHVVRMHTCAYVRRVLRKLAPYASIQISHLATCVPTLSELPYVCLLYRRPRALSGPLRRIPFVLSPAFLFLCLTLFAFILSILTDSYHSLTLVHVATSSTGFLAP